MNKLLPFLLIIFFHITAYCNIVIQEVVGRDIIMWELHKDSAIISLRIEKDRNEAFEYGKKTILSPSPIADVKIREGLSSHYFTQGIGHMEQILLHCFSEDDLSKLFKIMSPKARLGLRIFLQAGGKVLCVEFFRIFAPITKSEFLTSTEVHRFMNNVKKSSFPKLLGLAYVSGSILIWQHHIDEELKRRKISVDFFDKATLVYGLQDKLNLLGHRANNEFQKYMIVDLLIAAKQIEGSVGLATVAEKDTTAYRAWIHQVVKNRHVNRAAFKQGYKQYYNSWLQRYSGQPFGGWDDPKYDWQWNTFFDTFGL